MCRRCARAHDAVVRLDGDTALHRGEEQSLSQRLAVVVDVAIARACVPVRYVDLRFDGGCTSGPCARPSILSDGLMPAKQKRGGSSGCTKDLFLVGWTSVLEDSRDCPGSHRRRRARHLGIGRPTRADIDAASGQSGAAVESIKKALRGD